MSYAWPDSAVPSFADPEAALCSIHVEAVLVLRSGTKVAYYDPVHAVLYEACNMYDAERTLGITYADEIDIPLDKLQQGVVSMLASRRVFILEDDITHGSDAVFSHPCVMQALYARLRAEEEGLPPGTARDFTRDRHEHLWAALFHHAIYFEAPVQVLDAMLEAGGRPLQRGASYPRALELAYARLDAAGEPFGSTPDDIMQFHITNNAHMYGDLWRLFDDDAKAVLLTRQQAWEGSARNNFIKACLTAPGC
jgi:hypothetical protein